jgi:CRISPR/Cas system-associated endonuclease Cas3-HD
MKALLLHKAIEKIRPGAGFSLTGDKYEGLVWLDTVQAKPTKEEFEAALKSLTEIEAEELVMNNRRSEYPPIGDQLDALWQGGQAAIDMKARIEAVKAKYPKPVRPV